MSVRVNNVTSRAESMCPLPSSPNKLQSACEFGVTGCPAEPSHAQQGGRHGEAGHRVRPSPTKPERSRAHPSRTARRGAVGLPSSTKPAEPSRAQRQGAAGQGKARCGGAQPNPAARQGTAGRSREGTVGLSSPSQAQQSPAKPSRDAGGRVRQGDAGCGGTSHPKPSQCRAQSGIKDE